jgi:phosphoenolpyruvate-protein phosphotransferase
LLEEAHVLAEAGAGHDDALFSSYKAFINDPVLINLVRTDVFGARVSAGFAVWHAFSRILAILERVQESHIREKVVDVDMVRGLLLEALGANEAPLSEPDLAGAVVVANLFSPSEMLSLVRAGVAAIVCEQGSRNSHVAILARNFNVPAVLGARGALAAASRLDSTGAPTVFLVDGASGVVVASPEPETQRKFEARRAYWKLLGKQLHERSRLPVCSLDGVRMEVHANADSSYEASAVVGANADGVGLFRLESFYMSRGELPGEDEILAEILALAKAMPEKSVTVRLLDAGADKQVPALERHLSGLGLLSEAEALSNPMGLRGARILLRDEALLRTQCRALVRANVHGNVRVLVPFVVGVEEVARVRQVLGEAWSSLATEGDGTGASGLGPRGVPALPAFGVMIETPAAVALADLLASEVDFFSIGTNDLTQHALVVDRASAEVAALYETAHPAIVRMLSQVVRVARQRDIPVSLCGEVASDALCAELLVGLGLRHFSCSPHAIPLVKETLRGLDVGEAESFVAQIMEDRTATALRARLQARFQFRFAGSLGGDGVADAASRNSKRSAS